MATAEKAGDVIKFWLGLLDIASMTKGVVNIFDDNIDPAQYLNGLEAAVRLFGRVARSTSTINSKRKGSFDCSLDARESDEVMTCHDKDCPSGCVSKARPLQLPDRSRS